MCLAAVKSRGLALEYVPPSVVDKEICLTAAVEFDGFAYVPEHILDADICLAAVTSHGNALQFVPPSMITKDICLAAFKKKGICSEQI